MALWTPAEITTALWLDAADDTTITIDTGVSAWADKSGNSRSPANTTDAEQPAVIAAEQNGLDVLRFDGSNDYLLFPSSTATDYALKFGTGSFAVFAVLRPAISASGYFFGARGFDIGWLAGLNGSPSFRLYNASEQWLPFPMSAITVTTDWQMFGATAPRGATGKYYKDGNLLQSTASVVGSATMANSRQVRVGSYTDDSNVTSGPFNGDIAEIVILSGVVADETRQLIEGYLAWKWGLEANLPSGHPYEDAAPMLPNILVRAILDQVYGLRLLQIFNQPYGDAARLRSICDQPYSDAARLRRKLDQLYGDSPRYRAAMEQLYNLQVGLRATCAQPYAIAEGQIRAAFAQLYNLQDKDLIRATLDMLYVLAAGEALVQRFNISVVCDGDSHTSMGNINIEQDDQSFYMVGELQLYSRTEATAYKKFSSSVVITVNAAEYYFIPGMVRESRQPGQDVFVVPLTSATILLQGPHSRLAAGELSGMAADLVAVLAAPFTISWQLVNWFIPPGRLAVSDGQAAIDIIRHIVQAVGGIVQTSPAGILICRPEYPTSVNQWATVTPDYYLTDQDDFFQIDHAPEQKAGYNKFNISDSQLSTGGLTMEPTRITATISEELVYMLPWDESKGVRLHHSGNQARVAIVAEGIEHQEITDEQIEIVGGTGRTSKPFYALMASRYGEADLGSLSIAEDGTITTAVAENSILYLSYLSRNWKFTVTDNTVEDVQFFPEPYTL